MQQECFQAAGPGLEAASPVASGGQVGEIKDAVRRPGGALPLLPRWKSGLLLPRLFLVF